MTAAPRSWSLGGLGVVELLRRVRHQLGEDLVLTRAAELAYFFLFSIFPLLLFALSLLGYLVQENAELREEIFLVLRRVMPTQEAYSLVHDTVHEIQEERSGGKLSLGLLLSVWAASLGMAALANALNRAFHQAERRRWWQHRLIAVALTLAFAGLLAVSLVLVFAGHALGLRLAELLGAGPLFVTAWTVARWSFLLLSLTLSFDLVYNYAPNLPARLRRWLTPGAVAGVALWLAGSLALRTYFAHFDTFSRTYGSLGGVIALLTWFYLTGLALLLGGEINSEILRAESEVASEDGEEGPGPEGADAVADDPEPVGAGDVV